MVPDDDALEDDFKPAPEEDHNSRGEQHGDSATGSGSSAQVRPSFPHLFRLSMKDAVPEFSVPYPKWFQSQDVLSMASLPTFTAPMVDSPVLKGIGARVAEPFLEQVASQRSAIFEKLRVSLKPLFSEEVQHGLNRAFLPPNLRSYAEEVNTGQVIDFLEQEGIPLYLVPRGRTAVRLLQAPDRPGRRRVLGDCYESITDDCATVLEQVSSDAVGDEIKLVLDGIAAMRSGQFRPAQAIFTVTLDTLIYRWYPDQSDQADRRHITNRKKGADVPDTIKKMGVHKALVWLPIWNAHESFWKHNGDKVPNDYSRHASVHAVSLRQYSKRNCVQALMLVTSLIGYTHRLITSEGQSKP